jgi:hypothetical protein
MRRCAWRRSPGQCQADLGVARLLRRRRLSKLRPFQDQMEELGPSRSPAFPATSSNEPHSPTRTAHPFCHERELFCFRIPAINKCSIFKLALDLRAGGVFLSNFMLRCKISPGIALTKVRFGQKQTSRSEITVSASGLECFHRSSVSQRSLSATSLRADMVARGQNWKNSQ